MKTEQQIRDELEVLKRNYENTPHKEAWMELYKKLSKEDRVLLLKAQSPSLLQEQIAAFEWVLKTAPEKSEIGYMDGGEIPDEIAMRLGMYHGRNIHDVNANTYRLREAYKIGNKEDIEKYLKILRKYVNGI